jgi:hypothetical protein
MSTPVGRVEAVTAKDELWVLTLLLTLAAMLYLATWFIDGRPGSREGPAAAPGETVSFLGQAPVLNHRPD